MSNCCKEGYRKEMKIELFEGAADQVGPIVAVADGVEGITRGTYR